MSLALLISYDLACGMQRARVPGVDRPVTPREMPSKMTLESVETLESASVVCLWSSFPALRRTSWTPSTRGKGAKNVPTWGGP